MTRRTPDLLRSREFPPEVLEAELAHVHAREFARLLQAAARLRAGAGAPPAGELARWRRRARRACALAELDGFEPAGQLRHALAHPLSEWAAAAELFPAERKPW